MSELFVVCVPDLVDREVADLEDHWRRIVGVVVAPVLEVLELVVVALCVDMQVVYAAPIGVSQVEDLSGAVHVAAVVGSPMDTAKFGRPRVGA